MSIIAIGVRGIKMIAFNIPTFAGKELEYISEVVLKNHKIGGDGPFTEKCCSWIERELEAKKAFLTSSCTHSLELSAIILDIKQGDEVIMPSFTFPSTANAFALRGARIVFVDIRPDTMNIDEELIENAITDKTKAIVPVHYAGVPCEMEKIVSIAKRNNIFVVEDAAQAFMSKYKDKAVGTIGDLGCFSFHETKNFTMGEGGALMINNLHFLERAETVRDKGTDKNSFLKGKVKEYTWVDIGSSFIPSELNSAYLQAQLDKASSINNSRKSSWDYYYNSLKCLEKSGLVTLPFVPTECSHNSHIFYIKCKDYSQRNKLRAFLLDNQISSAFHYSPLHSSKAGRIYGRFNGKDKFTTKESQRLLRLPLYYGIDIDSLEYIIGKLKEFYT